MILFVENVSFQFKKQVIFDQANLTIDEPGIYGLIGPNGVGKTTLLHLISDLYKPNNGKIEIFEKSNSERSLLKEFSFVQDSSVLFPYLSAYDHLYFVSDMHGIDKQEIERTAEFLGMTGYLNKKVKTYSLGMKQRLLLATGLIKKPKLLLLDEPLNGLDPTSTILLREALLESAKSGMTVLVSSHNLSEIDKITAGNFYIKDKNVVYEESSQSKKEYIVLYIEEAHISSSKEKLDHRTIAYEASKGKIEIEINDLSSYEVMQNVIEAEIPFIDFEKRSDNVEARYRSLFEAEEGLQ